MRPIVLALVMAGGAAAASYLEVSGQLSAKAIAPIVLVVVVVCAFMTDVR